MWKNPIISSDEQQLINSYVKQLEDVFAEKELELTKKLENLRLTKKVFEINKKDYGWYSAMELARKIKKDY